MVLTMENSSDSRASSKVLENLGRSWRVCLLRWLWLAIALLVISINRETFPLTISYAYIAIGVGGVVNLFHTVALAVGWYPLAVRWIGVALDVVLAIVLLGLTGAWGGSMLSFLLPVLLFPVLVASLYLTIEAGLVAALLISVAYVVALLVDGQASGLDHTLLLGVNMMLLLFVALVSGLLGSGSSAVEEVVGIGGWGAVQRANQRAQVIQDMATTLSATLDYDRVLRSMLDLSLSALSEGGGEPETALAGLVLLFEEERNFDRLRVYIGRNISRVDEKRVVSGQSGIIAQVVHGGEPAFEADGCDDPVLAQLFCMQSAASVLCVPLRAGLDVFGVVVFASRQPDYFTTDQAELLTTFSRQAVIALKNAQLYQDLKTEQRRILEKEFDARHKLARELHDGPTQTIAAMAMRLNFTRLMVQKRQPQEKVVEELAEIEDLARKATQDVRMMLFTLRPVVLETQGLVAALEQYADRLEQTDEISVRIDDGGYEGELGKESEGVVFSVVEEAVGNARKHARATLIEIQIKIAAQLFSMDIKDNGDGFDLQTGSVSPGAGAHGLAQYGRTS